MTIGYTFPFLRSTGSIGYFQGTEDELDAVKQNLKSLIFTNWGERVMHFNFGCNLIEFLFENLSGNELKERISDRITSQTATWLPFVSINELFIIFHEDDPTVPVNAIRIKIRFFLEDRPDLFETLDETFNSADRT
jgi:phage baseplate assembly protein W